MKKKYTGKALEDNFVEGHEYEILGINEVKNQKEKVLKENIPPYYPSKELIEAVEYAILLKRPLLLRGEPGCGKTKLAQAIAYEWYAKRKRELSQPLL
jgi:MoxR-like ATPase